ncbi:hypothetical protein L3Q82_021021, partial [Scortum barcoo]
QEERQEENQEERQEENQEERQEENREERQEERQEEKRQEERQEVRPLGELQAVRSEVELREFPVPVTVCCFGLCWSSVSLLVSAGLSPPSRSHLVAAQMYRAPVRPQRSPGAPRPDGRFPSPACGWGFPGIRSPYGGSPRGGPAHSPRSPAYSPSSYRGCWDGSPSSGFGSRPRGSWRSGGSRGFGGQNWRRGGGFRRSQSFSPASSHNFQVKSVFKVQDLDWVSLNLQTLQWRNISALRCSRIPGRPCSRWQPQTGGRADRKQTVMLLPGNNNRLMNNNNKQQQLSEPAPTLLLPQAITSKEEDTSPPPPLTPPTTITAAQRQCSGAVRITFLDFSSAFNTIQPLQPLLLRDKLTEMGVG